MNKVVFLSVEESYKWWEHGYKIEQVGAFTKVTVKNSVRSIKKVQKKLRGETVLVVCGNEMGKISDYVTEYREISPERILPIIGRVLRQTAHKNGIGLPLEDCYIAAPPKLACRIIEKIYTLSRIFTVISDEDTSGEIYDELYFKHGVPVRQLPSFCNSIPKESILIRANDETLPTWAEIPVMDMSMKPSTGKNAVDILSVYTKSEKISEAAMLWKGKSPLMLYELLGEYPEENQAVNITVSTDKIFLLDTGAI